MAAVTAAVVGATVAAASLYYSIDSGNKQRKAMSDAQGKSEQDAKDARVAAGQQQKAQDMTDQRNLDLSNQRRRIGAPLAAITTGANPAGGGSAGSAVAPTQVPGTGSGPTSPATVTRGSGTLLGS